MPNVISSTVKRGGWNARKRRGGAYVQGKRTTPVKRIKVENSAQIWSEEDSTESQLSLDETIFYNKQIFSLLGAKRILKLN